MKKLILTLAVALTVQTMTLAQKPLKPVSVLASNEYRQHVAARAFDGSALTFWSSGKVATQWIEADLGSVKALSQIQFTPSLERSTQTEWEVWVSNRPIRGNTAGATRVKHFRFQMTTKGAPLVVQAPKGTRAQFVQIRCLRKFPDLWVAVCEVSILPFVETPPAPKAPIVGNWSTTTQNLREGAISAFEAREIRDGRIGFTFFVVTPSGKAVVIRTAAAENGLRYRLPRQVRERNHPPGLGRLLHSSYFKWSDSSGPDSSGRRKIPTKSDHHTDEKKMIVSSEKRHVFGRASFLLLFWPFS